MMAEKIALITGATGFVGSRLAKHLLSHKWEVHVIVRSTSDLTQLQSIKKHIVMHEHDGGFDSMREALKKSKPNMVFHLASCVLSEHKSEDVAKLIESNVLFGTQLLEAMRLEEVKFIINTGTNWQHYNNQEFDPVNLYAATKQAFEDVLKFYIESEGFKAVTLTLFDTYGIDDPRQKLLNLLWHSAKNAEAIDMTPGEQYIDIVNINDVVDAYLYTSNSLLTNKISSGQSYAVSSGQPIQLKDFVTNFERATGLKPLVNWGARSYRNREMMEPWSGVVLPGWEPKVGLEAGLREWSIRKEPTLTIGIPTYNRKTLVTELLNELLSANLPKSVRILVIDNASTDGTFEHLVDTFSSSENIEIKQNSENLGYAGNFFKLFDECMTDFLLITSDEDSIVSENLEEYLSFIERNKPAFICPQAFVRGKLYRGTAKTAKMVAQDYRSASFYLSGITFNLEIAKRYLDVVRDLLNKNMAATLYPQMLLTALLIIKGDCFWWGNTLTSQNRSSKTHIGDTSGSPYYFLAGRWSQYKGYIEFFEDLVSKTDSLEKEMALQMLQKEQSEMFGRLRDGIAKERPDLLAFFDEGAKRQSSK